jgi:hypothetical protein
MQKRDNMDRREKLARAICDVLHINPDGGGEAITQETKARLGDRFPFWQYWTHVVDRLVEELETNG